MPVATLDDTRGVRRDVPWSSFTAPFWEATKERRLLVQYCSVSGQPQYPPRPNSHVTGRRTTEWREVSGEGTIVAATIARIGRGIFQDHAPYAIVAVRLTEGVTIVGNIVDTPPERIVPGQSVKPFWLPLPDGRNLLMFRDANSDR